MDFNYITTHFKSKNLRYVQLTDSNKQILSAFSISDKSFFTFAFDTTHEIYLPLVYLAYVAISKPGSKIAILIPHASLILPIFSQLQTLYYFEILETATSSNIILENGSSISLYNANTDYDVVLAVNTPVYSVWQDFTSCLRASKFYQMIMTVVGDSISMFDDWVTQVKEHNKSFTLIQPE